MIQNLPIYISIIFFMTTVVTFGLFMGAIKNASSAIIRAKTISVGFIFLIWLVFQGFLASREVYVNDINSFPPKFFFMGFLPTLFMIGLVFATKKGRFFVDSLPLKNLTFLSIVRIPVEIVLFLLFIYKTIPELMTFEGRNFDILAGLTAPIIVYFGLNRQIIPRKAILIWNITGLGLLVNIVVNAVFSLPSPIQKFGFNQPNIAVLYFPFCWLPTFIVPIVLFSHLVSIRQLLKDKRG
ncbi:MAG: hypothetical protein ACRCVT_12055 [Leadbetterella sp.]